MSGHVRLTTDGNGNGRLVIDGHDVSESVLQGGVSLTMAAYGLPTLHVEVAVRALAFDGEARVVIDDDMAALLRAAGWTRVARGQG